MSGPVLFNLWLDNEYRGDHFSILQGFSPEQPAHLYGLRGWFEEETGSVVIYNDNEPGTAIYFFAAEMWIEEGAGAPLVDRAIKTGSFPFRDKTIVTWNVIPVRENVPGDGELRGGECMYIPVKRPEFTEERKEHALAWIEAELDLSLLQVYPAFAHNLLHWRFDYDYANTLVATDPDEGIDRNDPSTYYADISRTPTGKRGYHWMKFEPNQHARAGGSRVLSGWRHGSAENWGSGTWSGPHYESGLGHIICATQLQEDQAAEDTLFLGWLQQAQRAAMGMVYSGPNIGNWVDEKDDGIARGTHRGKIEPAKSRAKQFPLQTIVYWALTEDPIFKRALDPWMDRLLRLSDWNQTWGARIPANDGLEGLRYAYKLTGDERYKAKAQDYGTKILNLPTRREDGLWPNMGNNGAAETSPWMQAKLIRALYRWYEDHGLFSEWKENLLDTMEALWELGSYDIPGEVPDPAGNPVTRQFLHPVLNTEFHANGFEPIPLPKIQSRSTDTQIRSYLLARAQAEERWEGRFQVVEQETLPLDAGVDQQYNYRGMRYRFRREDGFWQGSGTSSSTNPQLMQWGLYCWRTLARERAGDWVDNLERSERAVYTTIGSSWAEVQAGIFYAPDQVGWEWAAWGVGGAPKRCISMIQGMRI